MAGVGMLTVSPTVAGWMTPPVMIGVGTVPVALTTPGDAVALTEAAAAPTPVEQNTVPGADVASCSPTICGTVALAETTPGVAVADDGMIG